MKPERIGIVGGSFDPIHLGHLIIAQEAVDQLKLDRALFIPASQAPLKAAAPRATADQRLAMTRFATADNPRFAVSTSELESGGISYSVDTARKLQSENPAAELHWILGEDQLAQLGRWREIDALCELVRFVAFARDVGTSATAGRPSGLPQNCRLMRLKGHPFAVSSTEIRRRAGAGQEFRYFLHPQVFDYIKAENLYGQSSQTE